MATEIEIRESVLNLIGNMTVNEFIEELTKRGNLTQHEKNIIVAVLSLYEIKFRELSG